MPNCRRLDVVGRQLGVSWASVGRQLGVVGFCTGAYVSFFVNEKTNLVALMQDAHFHVYICIIL